MCAELIKKGLTQLTFTCSNSTIETLDKSVIYVQSILKDTRTKKPCVFIVNVEHISHFFLVLLLLTKNVLIFGVVEKLGRHV